MGTCRRGNEYAGDTGTAARFFFQAQADALDDADPLYYCAKASRRERDAGLEGMAAVVRNITEGHGRGPINTSKGNGDGIRENKPCRNVHPTVKPLSLTRYLATLLLPPAAYAPRRMLVWFAGTGSEMIGAWQAGWEDVVGVEREAEYVDIANARIAYWCRQPVLLGV